MRIVRAFGDKIAAKFIPSSFDVSSVARFAPDVDGKHVKTQGVLRRKGSADAKFPKDGLAVASTMYVEAGLNGLVELKVWADYRFGLPQEGFNPLTVIPLPVDIPDGVNLPNPNSDGGVAKPMEGSISFSANFEFGSTIYGNAFTSNWQSDNESKDSFMGNIPSPVIKTASSGAILSFTPRFIYNGPGEQLETEPINFVLKILLTKIQTRPAPTPPPPTPRPQPPAPNKKRHKEILKHTIYFLFNKSDHLSKADDVPNNFPNKLNQLRELRVFMDKVFSKYGKNSVTMIELFGFASAPGRDEYNDYLSSARANNIAQWLKTIYAQNISEKSIYPKGESENQPNEKDNPKARRVDLRLTVEWES